jgi:hypothetical protein
MAQDPRLSLQHFITSLERHFEAVSTRRSPGDPAVKQAYYELEDAFLAYEEALEDNFQEFLPMMQLEEDEE